MSQSVDCEPYLSDYAVCFHQVFTLIDPAMNTSEIKPLHLSVPRTRGAVRPTSTTSPNIATTTKPDDATSGVRHLQHTANSKASSPSTLPNIMAQVLTKPLKSNSPDELSQLDNKAITDSLLKVDEFWLYPLAASTTIRFIISIDTTARAWIFRMLAESDGQLLLTAAMNGRARAVGVHITQGERDLPIGEGKFDQAANALFGGVAIGTERGEAGCWMYGAKEFLIPAIKKFEGKARMCLIPMMEASELCARAGKNAKEVIKLKCVDPGDDRTFLGKFEQPSPSNCQLFHESNPKKMLCSFGACSNKNWILEVTYPLSPLQGFIVAVAATIP